MAAVNSRPAAPRPSPEGVDRKPPRSPSCPVETIHDSTELRPHALCPVALLDLITRSSEMAHPLWGSILRENTSTNALDRWPIPFPLTVFAEDRGSRSEQLAVSAGLAPTPG